MFGARIDYHVGLSAKRRRDCLAIHGEQDLGRATELCRQLFPYEFLTKYPSMMAYLRGDKKTRVSYERPAPRFVLKSWALPREVAAWYAFNFTDDGALRPVEGRHTSLLLIGHSLTGKSTWALTFGRPDHVRGRFNLDKITSESTHLVLDDIDVRNLSCWRELAGCQAEFEYTDRYRPVQTVAFDKPAVFLCNPDQDPRKYRPFSSYSKACGMVVVDIGATPLWEHGRPAEPRARSRGKKKLRVA